jgi:uncharacterized protein
MKNGLVIADSGPIFSLAVVDKLSLLNLLFDEIKIPRAVWAEITLNENTPFFNQIRDFFKDKVCDIKGFNELSFIMDYGESESVVLYKEQQANFLLIDDKKAREIAENLGINCIGTIGLLSISKDKGFIKELRPVFKAFLENKRFYSLRLLNSVLLQKNEEPINC